MNAATDSPLLVAPRPVRLTSAPPHNFLSRARPVRLVSAPVEQLDRPKLTDDAGIDDLKIAAVSEPTETERPSPRLSPRSSLPSEALEEFLSILRPSFFPPSPTRARRPGANSFPYPYKSRGRIELVQQKHDHSALFGVDEIEQARSAQLSRNAASSSESDDEGDEPAHRDFDSLPMRWISTNNLSSPVSRMHTRNPWQRHPSYEIAFTGFLPSSRSSPSALSPVPVSPSTVPLPPPTPGEVIEVA